jgi:hypothetical protein
MAKKNFQEIKVVYLVIASKNSINMEDEKVQRYTFGEIYDNKIYWLRGEESIKSPSLESSTRTLFVPVAERQDTIMEKTILGVKWLLEHEQFDVLIRTNVSSYFHKMSRFNSRRLLQKHIASFGGFLELQPVHHRKQFGDGMFATGSGIFLNRLACELLLKANPANFRDFPDDVAISHFLRSKGAEMLSVRRSNLHITGIFLPASYMRLKSSISPKRTGERMKLVHSFFTEQNLFLKIKHALRLQIEEFSYVRRSQMRRKELFQNFLPSRKILFLNIIIRITRYQGKSL